MVHNGDTALHSLDDSVDLVASFGPFRFLMIIYHTIFNLQSQKLTGTNGNWYRIGLPC